MNETVISKRPLARVFCMHGIVEMSRPHAFSTFNFMETAAFVAHLDSRPAPYVSVNDALRGQGDALTIDDATLAALDAAVLARRRGHAVTLYVNPYNILHQQPYFFSVLSLLLDRSRQTRISVFGESYALNDFAAKLQCRRALKQHLCSIPGEEGREEYLTRLADALSVSDLTVPPHLWIAGLAELRAFRSVGGNIGNHGWTHSCIAVLPTPRIEREIRDARDWITATFEDDAETYAVPFGVGIPAWPLEHDVCPRLLLNTSALNPGWLGPTVFNRVTLPLE